jgi:hypothetical protein
VPRVDGSMNIEDYLSRKIVRVQNGRLVSEIIWAIGSCIAFAGLIAGTLLLAIPGFSMLFIGSYLSLHFELRRIRYSNSLEQISNLGP